MALMPESSDLAIFVMTDDRQKNGQTEPITLPLAHACGVTNEIVSSDGGAY